MVITMVSKDQFRNMWMHGRCLPEISGRRYICTAVGSVDIIYDYLMSRTEDVIISLESMPNIIIRYREHDIESFVDDDEYWDYWLTNNEGVSLDSMGFMSDAEVQEILSRHPACIGSYVNSGGIGTYVCDNRRLLE